MSDLPLALVFGGTRGIGAACVGAAGAMMMAVIDVTPTTGPAYTLLAFVIVITGGLGSMPGALLGGLLIGVTEALGGVLLIGLIYYVFAVMATKMFGDDKPELFGTLGDSLFTLFTVMTLEGWVDGVTRPVMEKHPWAWVFFIVFIVVTTFMVLNLFIGVVVNAIVDALAEFGERQPPCHRVSTCSWLTTTLLLPDRRQTKARMRTKRPGRTSNG